MSSLLNVDNVDNQKILIIIFFIFARSVIQNSTNSIINELRNSITSLVKLSSDKNEKLQSKKIVADFNLVIKKYLEVSKHAMCLKNLILTSLN